MKQKNVFSTNKLQANKIMISNRLKCWGHFQPFYPCTFDRLHIGMNKYPAIVQIHNQSYELYYYTKYVEQLPPIFLNFTQQIPSFPPRAFMAWQTSTL